MNRAILLLAGLAFLTLRSQSQAVTDYDGNAIPNVTGSTEWASLSTGAYSGISWLKSNMNRTTVFPVFCIYLFINEIRYSTIHF
jgi:hypothetical protein